MRPSWGCPTCRRRHRVAHRQEFIYSAVYLITWIVLWHVRAIKTTWRKL